MDQAVSTTKGKSLPPSHVPFDKVAYGEFQRKPLDRKRDYLRDQWLDVAYITLGKAKLFAQSVTKKDYGKLVQLLMASGISWDKVFPKDVASVQLNLVQNLFNGLPQGKVIEVIGGTPQASIDIANASIVPCPPNGDTQPMA